MGTHDWTYGEHIMTHFIDRDPEHCEFCREELEQLEEIENVDLPPVAREEE